MPNLALLDILIAMVVVILVLSLVVQSIQTVIKKVLKLKSHSIRSSLVDLFETIIDRPGTEGAPGPGTQPNSILDSLKGLFTKFIKQPAAAPDDSGAQSRTPEQLVSDVTNRLKDMGRKTLFGRPMLDSLAKPDLLKILTRVKADDLIPGTVTAFTGLLAGINQLKEELTKIDTNLLQGDASAKFATMQGLMMPVLHDLEALASGGKIDPAVFFGDLYQLRQIKPAAVLEILGQVQQGVSQDLAAAKTASDAARKALVDAQLTNVQTQIDAATQSDAAATGKLKAVAAVDEGLKNIAQKIASLSAAFDAAFAPLVARLEQVDAWYDTVMQGFDERYTRHMKTWGIAISIVVVIFLNANFFSIYRALKADPVMTQAIGQQGQAILKSTRDEKAKQAAAATQPANPSGTPNPSATPTPEPPPTVADVQAAAQKTKDLLGSYESFGIKPLSRKQISDAFQAIWAKITGKPSEYKWRDFNETFLGWALMVALLSAGAPFWEDTLESLFGIKNLIRQKGGTKNIEEDKGGQPKP